MRRSAEINEINAAYAAATVRSPPPSGRDTYRTLADYNAAIDTLGASRPAIAKKLSLPHKSLDGRPVHGIEIGRDVRAPEDGRPVFALFGLHHAREWPSGELAMEFAFDLVQNYGKDPRITGLLDKARARRRSRAARRRWARRWTTSSPSPRAAWTCSGSTSTGRRRTTWTWRCPARTPTGR